MLQKSNSGVDCGHVGQGKVTQVGKFGKSSFLKFKKIYLLELLNS